MRKLFKLPFKLTHIRASGQAAKANPCRFALQPGLDRGFKSLLALHFYIKESAFSFVFISLQTSIATRASS